MIWPTPTVAEMDAILDAVLVGGSRKCAELEAVPLCFGYKTADGVLGPVRSMPGKDDDGACVVENKCDTSLLSGKPSRETPRGFLTAAGAGRSVWAHRRRVFMFCASVAATFWRRWPFILLFSVLRRAEAAERSFMAMLFGWFAAANPRVMCLGFQGGVPIFNEEGAVVAAFAGSGARGDQDEDCLREGLKHAGLEDRPDGVGFVWRRRRESGGDE